MRARALAIVPIVLAARVVLASAGPVSFEPPSRVREAQAHFKRGTELFDAFDFANAATEYAAAYALDPDAKWLLLDIAIARRKANACPEAIEAYDAFIAAGPPEDELTMARKGVAGCAEILAQARREEDAALAEQAQRAEQQRAAEQERAAAVERQRVADDQARRDREAAELATHAVRVRHRALALGATSAGLGLVASGLYLFARHEASAASSADSLGGFHSDRANAFAFQSASQITGIAAVALAATAAIYYRVERVGPVHAIALAPVVHGALLVVGGAL